MSCISAHLKSAPLGFSTRPTNSSRYVGEYNGGMGPLPWDRGKLKRLFQNQCIREGNSQHCRNMDGNHCRDIMGIFVLKLMVSACHNGRRYHQ